MNTRSTSFSPVAHIYDATRTVPRAQIEGAIARIESFHGGKTPVRTLDLGCGTGQFAVCLAERGHRVIGIDLSEDMIRGARGKGGTAIDFRVRDARDTGLETACIDLCVSSKLFLHIENWQQAVDEILRIVRPGGCFAYINESGFFDNRVRRRFRRIAADKGFRNRFPGPHNPDVIRDHLRARGCEYAHIPASELGWERRFKLSDAYEELRNRAFAEFWMIPDATYDEILADVAEWIETLPRQWDAVDQMTPGLRIDLYRLPSSAPW